MTNNLLRSEWDELDSAELRILLDKRIGGPGQYEDRTESPNKFYLPLAGSSCRVCLTFRQKKIVAVEPGPAFDTDEWERICNEIESSVLAGPESVGREYSFSSFRVQGWWRGEHSGVQILPPPADAPPSKWQRTLSYLSSQSNRPNYGPSPITADCEIIAG
jgi:hypothetical protein